MHLQKLSVVNFKNYSEANLSFSPNINCLVGNNGVGKTNLLDAIYYLSFCKSYFNPIDSQNIKHDEPFFVIQGNYTINDENHTVYCGQKRGHKKQFKHNKHEYEKLADHIGKFPLVMVSPSDIDIITGGGEERRKLINGIISQFDNEYLQDVMNYQKALAHRNALLKQIAQNRNTDYGLFELLDEQLVRYGESIYQKRKEFITEFIPIFQDLYSFITQEKEQVSLEYISPIDKQPLAELFKDTFEKDKALQYTSTGVQRDDLNFLLSDYPLKKTGSQGQKKSFLIALKLAKFDFIKKRIKSKPTLLLDDIFDKLDHNRVKKIIELVESERFGQIFITDTNRERISDIMESISNEYKIFTVKEGEIEE